jgi:hypothetical protein
MSTHVAQNPRAVRALGSKRFQPSKGHRREKAARGQLEVKQAPRVPMPRKTLERREPPARNDINSLKKGARA